VMIISMVIIAGCSDKNPTKPATVTSVEVSPDASLLVKGQTQQFSAVVNGSNNPSQSVTWSITGGVTGTTISSSGLLAVADNETATTLTMRATSTYDPTKSGVATVTIPQVTTLVVNPATVTIARGLTQQFSAVVNGHDNLPQTVIWAVTGGGTGTSINSSGLLTVGINESVTNTLTVRATSTYDTTKSGTATVTVVSGVTNVIVSPATIAVAKGFTQQFTATVNGTNEPPQTVTWTLTGGGTGTSINTNGLLTVASTETVPTLTVRATSTYDNTKSGTATVTVTEPPPTAWTVTDLSTWNAAVNGIRNGGNDRAHVINVNSNVSVPMSTDNTFGNVTGLTVTIQGNNTLTVNNAGSLLIVGSNQTVVLNNITLQGRNGNSQPVVKVYAGNNLLTTFLRMEGTAKITGNTGKGVEMFDGTLTMKDNAQVTGNSDGGVYASSSSTFIMQDNAIISNNTTNGNGGGVMAMGIFIMQGNATISGNVAGSGGYGGGGGVYFSSGGTFTMSGNSKVINNTVNNGRYGGGIYIAGAGFSETSFIFQNGSISNNTVINGSIAEGGGLYVSGNISVIMQNGIISGNTTSVTANNGNAYGGGVYVAYNFTMQGGTISGNSVSGKQYSVGGGGIYSENGTITISGGVLSGNTVTNTSSSITTRLGGGVYGNLVKTGGTIYGNDTSETLKNISGRGHAIHNGTNWRNITAGPNDNSADYGFWTND